MPPRDLRRTAPGPPPLLTRRELVRAGVCAAALVALGGCTGTRPAPRPSARGTAGPIPPADRRRLAGLTAAQRELASRYADIAAQAGDAPTRRLGDALWRSHAQALRLLGVPVGAPPPVPGQSAPPSAQPRPPARPDWAGLARAEADTARSALDLVTAVGPDTAARVARVGADGQANAARLAVGPAGTAAPADLARTTAILPVGTPGARPPGTQALLIDVLRGEDAAVWAYQVVAARSLPGAQRGLADASLSAHRLARERAERWVVHAGRRPPAPAAGYALPARVNRPGGQRELAGLVEQGTGRLWAQLVPLLTGPARRVAAVALTGARIRAVLWAGAGG